MNRQEFKALCVRPVCSLRDALQRLDATARGVLLVQGDDGVLLRTVTDGDLRRARLQHMGDGTLVASLPAQTPITVNEAAGAAAVLAVMDKHQIDHVPVLNASGCAVDVVFRRELPRCVTLVNLYGQCADMDALLPIFVRDGVPVLENAAESFGGSYKGRSGGTFGRKGVYSFKGNKIITTSGGGMLVADDADLVARVRELSTQARDPAPHHQHSEMGFNYRMRNVLAGIGRGQLRVLDQRVAQRRCVFERYRQVLTDRPDIQWTTKPPGFQSTRWLTCLPLSRPTARQRCAAVIQRLERHSIEARPVCNPMHLQPLFFGAPYFNDALGEDGLGGLFQHGLCLPSGFNTSEDQQDRVIMHLRRALVQSESLHATT